MAQRLFRIAAIAVAALALVAGGYAIGTRGDSAASARAGQHAHARGIHKLATKLGVTDAALRTALRELRPQRREARRNRRAERIAELAKALDVSEAKVRAALKQVRSHHRQEAQQRRDAFATALAGKLGLDAAKVKAALADFAAQRHRHRFRHP